MKTIAHDILDKTTSSADAYALAEELCIEINQNYEKETTYYTFSDDSKLEFNNGDVTLSECEG